MTVRTPMKAWNSTKVSISQSIVRWAMLAQRTVDWLMLTFVLFHAFMGLRTVIGDYTTGGLRTFLTMLLYLVGIVLFAMGTMVVVTLPMPQVPA